MICSYYVRMTSQNFGGGVSMALKAAFMFLASNANSKVHSSTIKTDGIHLISVGVSDYKEACEVAEELFEQGIGAIELCGGFGNKGAALVTEAVKGKIPVGVVRFDIHPGLGNRSGDIVFCK